jgi:Fe-S-cluster containining protein
MKLDVLDDAKKQAWYSEGLSFTCTQCGNCCTGGPGYVWVSEEELSRLAEFLKLTLQQVKSKYARRIGEQYSLKEHRNSSGAYDCIFLKEVKAESTAKDVVVHARRICEIYPVRPLQCRTWPFWDGNLSSQQSWNRASKRCPGMNEGKHFTFEQIEKRRTAKDWLGDRSLK